MAKTEDAPDDQKKTETKPVSLHWAERVVAGLVAIVVLVAAFRLVSEPPEVSKFAPQCAAGTDCIGAVNEVPDGLVLALVGFAVVMAFMAINGLKISTLKVAGAEIKAVEPVEQKAETALMQLGASKLTNVDTAGAGVRALDVSEVTDVSEIEPAAEPAGSVKIGQTRIDVFERDAVPLRVLADLASAEQVPVSTAADVEYAVRPAGSGNHPWTFKVEGDDALWKVSYAGPGAETAVVRELTT